MLKYLLTYQINIQYFNYLINLKYHKYTHKKHKWASQFLTLFTSILTILELFST